MAQTSTPSATALSHAADILETFVAELRQRAANAETVARVRNPAPAAPGEMGTTDAGAAATADEPLPHLAVLKDPHDPHGIPVLRFDTDVDLDSVLDKLLVPPLESAQDSSEHYKGLCSLLQRRRAVHRAYEGSALGRCYKRSNTRVISPWNKWPGSLRPRLPRSVRLVPMEGLATFFQARCSSLLALPQVMDRLLRVCSVLGQRVRYRWIDSGSEESSESSSWESSIESSDLGESEEGMSMEVVG